MIGLIFPGQGSQEPGMGRAAAEAFPEARRVFEEADAILGFSLSRLCFEGPEEELKLTHNTQPALLATSVALFRVLESRGIPADFVAGHSLGEYSALVAAGSLRLADALPLVRRRGQYMQEAVPLGVGAMAAVLGLELAEVEAACREASTDGEVVEPANLNGPAQVVIAGHAAAVARASEQARSKGARRVAPLPVSAPFHCRLMQPAADRLAGDLEATAFGDLAMPLVTNVDALPIRSGREARQALLRQVASPVRWEESVRRLVSEGVNTFLEVGPGSVLTGLVRKIAREARATSVSDPEGVEKFCAGFSGQPASPA
jgi:[acyl-carrier-protein] S-malonyltransferase